MDANFFINYLDVEARCAIHDSMTYRGTAAKKIAITTLAV